MLFVAPAPSPNATNESNHSEKKSMSVSNGYSSNVSVSSEKAGRQAFR